MGKISSNSASDPFRRIVFLICIFILGGLTFYFKFRTITADEIAVMDFDKALPHINTLFLSDNLSAQNTFLEKIIEDNRKDLLQFLGRSQFRYSLFDKLKELDKKDVLYSLYSQYSDYDGNDRDELMAYANENSIMFFPENKFYDNFIFSYDKLDNYSFFKEQFNQTYAYNKILEQCNLEESDCTDKLKYLNQFLDMSEYSNLIKRQKDVETACIAGTDYMQIFNEMGLDSVDKEFMDVHSFLEGARVVFVNLSHEVITVILPEIPSIGSLHNYKAVQGYDTFIVTLNTPLIRGGRMAGYFSKRLTDEFEMNGRPVTIPRYIRIDDKQIEMIRENNSKLKSVLEKYIKIFPDAGKKVSEYHANSEKQYSDWLNERDSILSTLDDETLKNTFFDFFKTRDYKMSRILSPKKAPDVYTSLVKCENLLKNKLIDDIKGKTINGCVVSDDGKSVSLDGNFEAVINAFYGKINSLLLETTIEPGKTFVNGNEFEEPVNKDYSVKYFVAVSLAKGLRYDYFFIGGKMFSYHSYDNFSKGIIRYIPDSDVFTNNMDQVYKALYIPL